MTRAKACPQPGRRAQRAPSEKGLSSRSWRAWRKEFSGNIDFQTVAIEDGGWPVSDVATSPMAVYGMVVAQLLFDDGGQVRQQGTG